MDKNRAYQLSDIILDNEKYLIVSPRDMESANYFLSPFDKFTSDRTFNQMIMDNDYYIIIYKGDDFDDGSKYTIRKSRSDGKVKFRHVTDNVSLDYNTLLSQLGPIKKQITELIGQSKIYELLKKVSLGDNVSEYEIERADDLISDIRIVKRLPLASKIILKFTLDEYLDLFEISDYDRSFCLSMLGNYYYNSWDFNLSDRIWEDFREGYFFRNFNEENTRKLSEIAMYVAPDIEPSDIIGNNEESLAKLGMVFRSMQNRYEDRLTSPYHDFLYDCYVESAREDIRSEICGLLKPFSFFQKEEHCYSTYFTSLGNLLNLYEKNDLFTLDIKGVLRFYMEKNGNELNFEGTSFGECNHNHWTTEMEDNLQEKFSDVLDDILDDILDNDEYISHEELRKTAQAITKKFEFHKWYELPKDDSKQIKFLNIDPKTNKVNYEFIDKEAGTGIKKSKGTIEDINLLLYHPEIDFKD